MLDRPTAATTPGLRARKKAATMTRVQEVAMDLFEERGFDRVTVEDVAAATDVSPSTIYRYFGTKEGLVLHDENDDLVLELVPLLVAQHGLVGAFEEGFRAVGLQHMAGAAGELSRRRTLLWYATPSIRAAGYLMVDEMGDDIARLAMQVPGHPYTETETRVIVGTIMGAFLATIRIWQADGARGDIIAMLLDTMAALRSAFEHPTAADDSD